MRLRSVMAALLLAALNVSAWGQQGWTQWGGSNRDFIVENAGELAAEWPESGPKELWRRSLGDGFSSILYDDGRLYTMRRDGDQDVVVSLDAESGEAIWETAYDSPTAEGMILDFGPGPISTPLISGDRLFTVSSTVKFHCLDKKTGDILWSRDLLEEMKASHMGRGYGPSPIAYQDLVILGVGGDEQAVVAFEQETGEVRWKSLSLPPSYSSPIMTEFDGEEMLIVSMGPARAGLDPADGRVIWRLDAPKVKGPMMTTQHLGNDKILFGSTAYGGGSQAIQLKQADGRIVAEELWYTRRMRIMYGSYVRIGDYVYGSSGDFGPAFLQCLDIKTGKVIWRKRGFSRANLLAADGKVIVLDEDGDLAIATVSPQGMTVHSQAKILERTAWTPPTLVGTTLYARNRKEIVALDLSGRMQGGK